jgi:hypothetical protein
MVTTGDDWYFTQGKKKHEKMSCEAKNHWKNHGCF